MNAWQPRCGDCGKFCDPVDQYTPWEDANPGGDPEPFDDVYLCASCARELFEKSLAFVLSHGIPHGDLRPYWHSPSAWYLAVCVARGMRRHGQWTPPQRHGLVRRETSGGLQVWTCGACRHPEHHPCHDPKEAARLHVKACWKFTRSVGRWVVPVHVRLWCYCGWSTPVDQHGTGLAWRELEDTLRAHVAAARSDAA